MINCAHPTHFSDALAEGESWQARIHAVRANASCKSHAELDEATQLDAGNPEELGSQYRELRSTLKNLHVVGGCCGTDHNHVDAIIRHWL
jgi:S-methylmethionine-dependent homocysteine/selenocysteine methylase